LLRIDPHPVRVSRRINNVVVYQKPLWILEPPLLIRGRRVLIVDEICSSGRTLAIISEHAAALGAEQVKSAVLYAHTWGTSTPDAIGLIMDALVLNPWDREILRDGFSSPTPSTWRP
jgi:hypoxanthine phosphoribosyltransferase